MRGKNKKFAYTRKATALPGFELPNSRPTMQNLVKELVNQKLIINGELIKSGQWRMQTNICFSNNEFIDIFLREDKTQWELNDHGGLYQRRYMQTTSPQSHDYKMSISKENDFIEQFKIFNAALANAVLEVDKELANGFINIKL